jgi:hypothetical protein
MVTITISTTILVSIIFTSITSFIVPTVTTVLTSAVVTITTRIPTSTLVPTSLFIPSTITSTSVIPIPTTSEYEVNVFPFHAHLLVYLLSAMYSCFNAWLVWFTHRDRFDKISYMVFFIVSIVNIILSGIVTVLSGLSFDGDLTAQVIWGQHFNIGTDVVTLFRAILRFSLVGTKTRWTMRYSVRRSGTPDRGSLD